WLAHDDQAALDQAGEVCLALADVNLVVRGRAAGLLARVRQHAPGMRNQAMVSYGERSADQAGFGGRSDLERAIASIATEVAALGAPPPARAARRRRAPPPPPRPRRAPRPGAPAGAPLGRKPAPPCRTQRGGPATA